CVPASTPLRLLVIAGKPGLPTVGSRFRRKAVPRRRRPTIRDDVGTSTMSNDRIVEIYRVLHQAGWSIGSIASKGTDGKFTWQVSGTNGENKIHVTCPTEVEAWEAALKSANEVGMPPA